MKKIFFTNLLFLIVPVVFAQTSQSGKCVKGICTNGSGTMIFSAESPYKQYTGNWNTSQFSGPGELIYKNGDLYNGMFNENQFLGYGVYTYANGDFYKGYHRDGKRVGYGEMKDEEGLYKGMFVDGNKQGTCTMTYADGREIKGKYYQGVFYPENAPQTANNTPVTQNSSNSSSTTSNTTTTSERKTESFNNRRWKNLWNKVL